MTDFLLSREGFVVIAATFAAVVAWYFGVKELRTISNQSKVEDEDA